MTIKSFMKKVYTNTRKGAKSFNEGPFGIQYLVAACTSHRQHNEKEIEPMGQLHLSTLASSSME